MKYTLPLIVFCLLLFNQKVEAQGFIDLNSMLENLNDQERNSIFDNLGDFDLVDLQELQDCGVLDQLYNLLDGELPDDQLGDLLTTLDNSEIYFGDLLQDVPGLGDADMAAIAAECQDIIAAYQNNDIELGTALDQDVTFEIAELPIDYNPNTNPLMENMQEGFNVNEFNPETGIQAVFDQIFDESLFSSLEIAYGRKEAMVTYYGTDKLASMENVQVVRVGTVPEFDQLFEPYWSGTISWTDNNFGFVTGGEGQTITNSFNPFVMEGEFGVMFNPGLTIGGIPNSRVITRLGVEAAAYMPAHIDPYNEKSLSNVGKTTACAPQLGTGYEITVGDLTTWILGTVSYGFTSNCPYPYSNVRFEAGARFGNAVNVRYSLGQQNWADGDNKRVQTRNQFTVGLIIDELFN